MKLPPFAPAVLMLIAACPLIADPPEDVLRPEPDPSAYYFIQPEIGLNVGMVAGNPQVRYPNISEDPASHSEVFDNGVGAGFVLGMSFGYVPTELLSARVNINYDYRAGGASGVVVTDCNIVDQFGGTTVIPTNVEATYSVSAQTLSAAVIADLNVGNFFGSLGYTQGFRLGATYDETDQISDDDSPCVYYPGTEFESKSVSGSYSESDLLNEKMSVLVGLGYRHPISGNRELVFGLYYDLQISPLYSEDPNLVMTSDEFESSTPIPVLVNGQTRVNALQLMFGLRFNLLEE